MSNTVVYMSDQHNPFYSTVYGNEKMITPNMQRLAETGIVFENAYCPSPLCLPSRSAFMAGERVFNLQTYNNCLINVSFSHLSYGAALKKRGIHSAYIGKTDVYAKSDELGFSEMIQGHDRVYPGDMKSRRNPMPRRSDTEMPYGPAKNGYPEYDVSKIDKALQWLETMPNRIKTPWILIVNTTKPHAPNRANELYWDMYEGKTALPEYGGELPSAMHRYARDKRSFNNNGVVDEETIIGNRRGYCGNVTYVDHELGRLMEALESNGLSCTTNLVYTSDHGEMLGKFDLWHKGILYEDSIRIPLIGCGPDFGKNGKVRTPVDLHDLRATLFQIAGAKQPRAWLGQPLMEIPANDEERIIFSEYHAHGAHASSFMVRRGKWKYIYYIDAESQLFDLENDPNELSNLNKKEALVSGRMEQELRKICNPEGENRKAEIFIEKQFKDWVEPNPE